MSIRHLHLVSYDIACNKRLRAALKLTRTHATGGQKSTHECWLSPQEKGDLVLSLSQLINEEEDSLIIIRLDPRQEVDTLGKALSPKDSDWLFIQ